ncbi:IS110 family transposase (plasmid) [Ensifer adhaerens]|uniref:IS110 family transposase n=1 Tax=Ensifer adhaerens TaxID=106592 RepID=UPI0023A91EAE|nr:IS110 family transposase [Ensifer adhaerens]WDZ81705.1 IS110 family transposase [Ensifer adhaerens]
MGAIATIGLDLAKSVFQVHAIDATGKVVLRRTLRRSHLLDFFERTPPCLVGMEACASAHYWTREIGKLGHQVRIMPAFYVKAYVKRNKTDAADAEAICEAVTRPTMRFVPVKSDVEQSINMMLKTRDLLTRQRTQLVNALRSHLAELGIVAAAGFKASAKLIEIVRDDTDHRLPAIARYTLTEVADQIERLTEKIMKLEKVIVSSVRQDDVSRRLTSIPGVGPITAAAVRALVPDPTGFRTGRDFAAWVGLTPRSNSSGGKQKLGSISKRGNPQLRSLFMVGAMAILRTSKYGATMQPWVASLLKRRPFKVVAVAMANKTARIIWALMIKGGCYEPTSAVSHA